MELSRQELIAMAKAAGMNTANDIFFQADAHNLASFASLATQRVISERDAALSSLRAEQSKNAGEILGGILDAVSAPKRRRK